MVKTIETERLILRAWQDEDLPIFARINSDPLIMEYMPRILPPADSDKLAVHFSEHIEKHGFGMYALETKESGEFVGTVGLNTVEFKAHFTPAVEVAWRLDYGAWGKGYATEAVQAVVSWAVEQPSIMRVWALCDVDNIASARVLEKVGME